MLMSEDEDVLRSMLGRNDCVFERADGIVGDRKLVLTADSLFTVPTNARRLSDERVARSILCFSSAMQTSLSKLGFVSMTGALLA